MPASHLTQVVAARGAALLQVRWFVRSPIWLYRARLGFVFGSRLLMLEHVGRTSGHRRYVVLEVIARPAPGRYSSPRDLASARSGTATSAPTHEYASTGAVAGRCRRPRRCSLASRPPTRWPATPPRIPVPGEP